GAERRARLTEVLVMGDRSTALDVPEHVVPGVNDLAGEEADRIDLGVVCVADAECGDASWHQEAGVRTLQVRPIALRFEAEHPVRHLPAVADLTTDHAAGRVMTAFADSREVHTGDTVEFPALVGRTAAAVDTDVEAVFVLKRRGHR